MSIDKLLDDLIAREGGYVNDPSDHGGETNFGITKMVARAFGYTGDMRLLPRTTAVAIYRTNYWTRPGFDQVAQQLPKLAEELFDTGVNMGPKTAATFLQRSLNVLNRRGVSWPDLTPDGDLGPMSLHALSAFVAQRGASMAGTVLLRMVDALQACRYISLAENDPSQEAFAYGWIANRVGIAD